MRAGIGFDVHAFDASRPLVLGGVTIPDAPGLAGHSDADVVCHAIADAMLGAAALGDMGGHFPVGDPEWKDVSSLLLLGRVADMTRSAGYVVASLDTVVLLEAPKIAQFRDQMRANIAGATHADLGCVGVKATTTDGLGLIGRGEGAACMAVALLQPVDG